MHKERQIHLGCQNIDFQVKKGDYRIPPTKSGWKNKEAMLFKPMEGRPREEFIQSVELGEHALGPNFNPQLLKERGDFRGFIVTI